MRRRWLYTMAGQPLAEPVELTEDAVLPEDTQAPVYTDRYMEGLQATDGTDISSRAKRREYMRRNNLADADDFKGTWAKAAQEGPRLFEAKGYDKAARREAIGRALYNLEKRGRR